MKSGFVPLLAAIVAAYLAATASIQAQIPAFPGVEGAGAFAVGGRNGDVYHVTNLNSSGAGSLAAGFTGVPVLGRTIVFDVSGYIPVSGTLTCNASKVTIAGQTAPGDGIGIRNGTFRLVKSDCIIRFFRFRDGNSADAINVDGTAINTVFDHCDALLSNDENFSSFNTPPDNLTFQWSINAWGMESHSAGGLWDQNHATAHHTLWSHNHTRNPKARPDGCLDWINNVTFDWDIGYIMGDSDTPANWRSNVRGCYFVCPPGNIRSVALQTARLDRNGNPNFTLYLDDCRIDDNGNGTLDYNTSKTGYSLASGSYATSPTPFPNNGIPVAIEDPLTACKKIISNAGPLRMDSDPARSLRDELTTILIDNLVLQRRHHVSSPAGTGAPNGGFGFLNSAPAPADTDRDGMPDFWETALGWNGAVDDHTTPVASSGGFVTAPTFFPTTPATPAGYTRLEEYLHFLAIPHTVMPKSTTAQPNAVDIDLRKFTKGFSSLPVFTLADVTGGTATQSGTGGYLVHFVPTTTATGVFGRAGFRFSVTDASGSSWVQQFGILVTANSIPRDLSWAGDSVSNVWNDTNQLWRIHGNPTTYGGGDNVLFSDAGSSVPGISLTGALGPSAVVVNATRDYTFTGSGAITGAASLTKQGPGKLTISNPGNGFSGEVQVQDGEIVVASGANLGSGILQFQDTTVTSTYGGGTHYNMANLLKVDAGATGTLNLSPRMTLNGATGAGTLNLMVSGATAEFERINGNWSNFTGVLNFTGTVPNALACAYFNGGNFTDFSKATVNLDNMNLGGRDGSGGNTLTIGSLTGTASSRLGGAHYAGPLTYVVGGLNKSTTFAGSITDGTVGGSATNITKAGSGTLTLTGPVTHSGTTTVSGGTLIVGGTLNGPLSVAAATISPSGPGVAGVLTATTVALTGSTLALDLSGAPGAGNDQIFTAGTGSLGGTLSFKLNLLDRQLGAGVYELIKTTGALGAAGGTALVLNPLLPTDTRQGFVLTRPSSGTANSSVKLTVTGTAASLVWTGAVDATWGLNTTTNWLNGQVADRFYNLDKVTFNDDSTVGGVTLTGSLQPREIAVNNSATPFTLGGGTFDGIGILTKTGPGTLTLTGVNGFSGGTTISAGILSISVGGALGTGPVTLSGGTLLFGGNALTMNNPIKVTADSSLAVASGSNTLGGSLSGAAALALNTAGQLFTVTGSFATSTGTLTLAGKLRFNQGTNPWGGAGTAFDLTGASEISNGAVDDVVIDLGALTGGGSAVLRGSDQAGTFVSTYRIGARNLDTSFVGAIVNGTSQSVALVKTGAGQLILGGDSTYTGATSVAQGILRLSGSISTAGAVEVLSAATLHLDGGTITALQVDIEPGGTLRGCGTITADVNNHGTLLADCGGALTVSGDVVNDGILRIANGTALLASGSFINNGTLDLLTGAQGLPPNLVNNGLVIDSTTLSMTRVEKSGNTVTLTAPTHSGHVYQLQRTPSLTTPAWGNVGSLKTGLTQGNGAPSDRVFTDPAATAGPLFYRVLVTP